MRTTFTILVLASLAGLARADVAANNAGDPRAGVLSLRTGEVSTAKLANMLGAKSFPSDPAVVMVLARPMNEDTGATLTKLGVVVRDYLPTQAYFADLSRVDPAALRATGLVASVHRVDAGWKLDPWLRKGAAAPAWSTADFQGAAARGEASIAVTVWRGVASGGLVAWLRGQRAVVAGVETAGGCGVVHVRCSRALAAAIAQRADAQYVEYNPECTERSNATTRWVVQSNIQGVESVTAHGITGVGSIVGHIDSGLAPNHCSMLDPVNPVGPLHRKVVANNDLNGTYTTHGTHTAGTLAGDDGNPGVNRGIAWGARLVHNNYPSYSEPAIYGRFELHRTQGAFVHSNSWGSDLFHTYELMCRAVDAFQHDHEDNLLVYAVSDSTVLGIPEQCKNALTVSASNNAPSQESMCVLQTGGPAVGPTADGRRRPDVVAPGCSIVSSVGSTDCGTGSLSGTSMACPAVAGVAVLTREYFTRGFYPSGVETPSDGFVPTGALLRAMIINSANDLLQQAGYPGDKEGWGRVLAEDSLFFQGDARRTVVLDLPNGHPDALQTGRTREVGVQVSGAAKLKVTLAWTDEPAAANASFAPVNDLDLVVTSPTGQVYLGNVFSGGLSVTGGSADTRNNTEQVHIAAPVEGVWTVEVVGAQVNLGPQGFSLVVTGGVSPVGCDGIDFNHDDLFPDTLDIEDFLSVFSGGACSNDPHCGDIDFNNDGLFPDAADIESLLRVFGGGGC
ncbi:MAG: S8 family serine peptidase [Phycisphaerales bacterium]